MSVSGWSSSGEGRLPTLGQDLFDDVTVDVGKTKVAALKAVGELFVVEA